MRLFNAGSVKQKQLGCSNKALTNSGNKVTKCCFSGQLKQMRSEDLCQKPRHSLNDPMGHETGADLSQKLTDMSLQHTNTLWVSHSYVRYTHPTTNTITVSVRITSTMPFIQMFDEVELHVAFKYQNETSQITSTTRNDNFVLRGNKWLRVLNGWDLNSPGGRKPDEQPLMTILSAVFLFLCAALTVFQALINKVGLASNYLLFHWYQVFITANKQKERWKHFNHTAQFIHQRALCKFSAGKTRLERHKQEPSESGSEWITTGNNS